MKIKLALISSLALLTACAGSYPERVVTKGPLICEANEVCPELAMRWVDEKRNGFKITAEINNPQQFDIKQMNFIIDGQPYVYSTIQPTEYVSAENGIKTSANSINVPVSFLNSFRSAKEIHVELKTDQGSIDRALLTADGKQSSAYLTFLKGYTGQ
ncbi:hypothetical protein EC844_10569 [Acinetobacter calcoaceticus]|uniref:Lipoprotein n=1 Tax=Acinetobacter calcoaceticus TaxID=471 RepID=A0A4R1XWF3_ACICA|nr:hypothetical protein EC844_10569 [Acinetobacter calcoaceticus]